MLPRPGHIKLLKGSSSRGQALAEFAIVFPLFVIVLFGIIVLGLGVFYQQQLNNAAREAVRHAAVSSAEAQCPTISNDAYLNPPPFSWFACDTPAGGWPRMTAAAKRVLWALDTNDVSVSACWSSYHVPGDETKYDQEPIDPVTGIPNTLEPLCTYAKVETDPASLACPPPPTTSADDRGTNLPGNLVTVYVCYNWRPPVSGVLFVPDQVTLRAVVTEVIHHQQ